MPMKLSQLGGTKFRILPIANCKQVLSKESEAGEAFPSKHLQNPLTGKKWEKTILTSQDVIFFFYPKSRQEVETLFND